MRAGLGRVMQGLVGLRENFGFYLEKGGSPRRLRAEEGQDQLRCSQVLSGHCWEDREPGNQAKGHFNIHLRHT